MKYFFSFITVYCFSFIAVAQQRTFNGTWEGDVDAGVQKIRLVFYVTNTENGSWKSSMQSPQQSAMILPADTTIIDSGNIRIEMKKFGISFSGKLVNDSSIQGEFKQGVAFPLNLKKVEKATAVSQPKRPQTPEPPFPYKSIITSFAGKDKSLNFGATLTLPDSVAGKKYPAVILISGSGPQDRDETIMGHKPFAVIADHLTKKGFAVLRYDDRGIAKSTGDFATATSADFADDAEAALDFLKQQPFIDAKNIGFIGHSEGGQIAPMIAAKRKDVKFIVLLAGPGIPCIDLMTEQNIAIFKSKGISNDAANKYGELYKKLGLAIIRSKDSVTAIENGIKITTEWVAPDSVRQLFRLTNNEQVADYVQAMVADVYKPWFRYFMAYDPAPALQKLSCAVLALNGSEDLQVLPASNLKGMEAALKKSKTRNYIIKEIPQLNHLFQTCNKCTMDEYGSLEESFSPLVLDIMDEWLVKTVSHPAG